MPGMDASVAIREKTGKDVNEDMVKALDTPKVEEPLYSTAPT